MRIDNKCLLDVLRRARDKVSDPKHWTRGTVARDYYDNEVHVMDDCAYKYCAIGAITTTIGINPEYTGYLSEYIGYLCNVMQEMYPNIHYLSEFNDSHKHAEVIALFDAAITKLEAT